MPRTVGKTKTYQFRLGPETLARLDAIAAHFDLDRTAILRMLIADAHAAMDSGHPRVARKIPRKPDPPS